MSNSKDINNQESLETLFTQIKTKFDVIIFDISDFKSKNIYDKENIEDIDKEIEIISSFLRSEDYKIIENFDHGAFQRLSQNLQILNVLNLLEPYEQLFKNHVIKLRSFPISFVNMNDSEIIYSFYQLLQSTILLIKSQGKFLYGFKEFHSLNYSITEIIPIIDKLMRIEEINDSYYRLLNQVNENLINFQNIINLAYKIEKDCNCLMDMEKSLKPNE